MINSKIEVLWNLDNLISTSCKSKEAYLEFSEFHIALIKMGFCACDIVLDYERNRIQMNLTLDQSDEITKGKIESLMPMNMGFKNLATFLRSCIIDDETKMLYYATLIVKYSNAFKSPLQSLQLKY